MNRLRENRLLRILIGYYGILQTMHLLFLGRAGIIFQQTGRVPFPASPPPGGWDDTLVPFLIGMAAVDVIAACAGINFSFSLVKNANLKSLIGIISLTIALTSAIIYLAGTLAAEAWVQNPVSYLIVLVAFSPIIPLYYMLVRGTIGKKGAIQ